MATYRWPHTLHGWKTLFWLWLGRCPIHHTALRIDAPPYDDGRTGFCFECHGIGLWPQGAREALRQNAMACEQAEARR
ncbi:hypothetical protein [Methylobacterium hispanicum]|uniref:hypothetical protein n=1 Tax=Methylobacterium hispanicum TaxID=270350 RepID=UPI002F2C12A8